MIIIEDKNRECAKTFSDYRYEYKEQITYNRKTLSAGLLSLTLTMTLPLSVMAADLPVGIITNDTQETYGGLAWFANGSGSDITADQHTITAKTAGIVTINQATTHITHTNINVSNSETASYSTSDAQYPADYALSDWYWR